MLNLLAHSLVSKECRVETKFSGQKLMLSSDVVTSLALILNELITNAIIHGFKGRSEGVISIDIRCEGETCVITVCDDGVGMDQTEKERNRKHLGMAIVQTLIEKDLHGSIAFSKANPQGTAAAIRFPLSKRGD